MSKPNIDGSFGKKSNLDVHPSNLDEQSYRHALNSNLESRDGSSFMLTNEQSNILCSRFGKTGYKVINATSDINTNRTYFFLTNPETGCSEIGYIEDTEDVNDLSDIENKCGCNISNLLAEALEDTEQEETCNYVVLVNDCCEDNEEGDKCLGFDINHPISAEIKQEKCGTVIYFTDDIEEHIRRIEVDEIEQYYYREVTCDEEEEGCDCGKRRIDVCLDCEKLLVFRSFSNPCIDKIEVINGGLLVPGNYVFYVTYADKNGETLSRYSAITGEVFIRDPNKTIYQQPELNTPTNQAVKLTLSRLDNDASHYKIAVRISAAIDGAVSNYEVGTYSVAQTEVILNSTQTLKRLTTEEILVERPRYVKAKTVESANNQLFMTDLESRNEVNLQPVVNFLGQFAKWRSFVAEEDIYNDPVLTEKYRTAMRNEVYPYGIRFGTSDYVTAIFPMIGRIATDDDIRFTNQGQLSNEDYINSVRNQVDSAGQEKDIKSILQNGYKCSEEERIYKWQYYNTATRENPCNEDTDNPCSTIEYEEVEITEERSSTKIINCDEGFNQILTSEEANFEEYEFTTADQFIRDFAEEIADIQDDDDCFKRYVENDFFDDPEDYVEDDCGEGYELFGLDADGNPELDEDGCPISTCSDVLFDRSETQFLRIVDETYKFIFLTYKDCDYYKRRKNVKGFNIYQTSTSTDRANLNTCCDDCGRLKCKNNKNKCDGSEPCCEWEYVELVDGSCHPKNPVFDRIEPIFGGSDCNQSDRLSLDVDYQTPSHLVPFYSDDEDAIITEGLLTDIKALEDNDDIDLERIRKRCRGNDIDSEKGKFFDKIHKNALWYNITDTPNGVVINISDMTDNCPKSKKDKDCLLYSKLFRFNLYNNDCSNLEPLIARLIGEGGDCNTNIGGLNGMIEIYNFTRPLEPVLHEANKTYIVEDPAPPGNPATFLVTRDNEGHVSTVEIISRGSSYLISDIITIPGDQINDIDDLLITVLNVKNDDSFFTDENHILYLSEQLLLQLFPDGVLLAIDAPIYQKSTSSQYDDADCITTGAIINIKPVNIDDINVTTPPADAAYVGVSSYGGQGTGATFDITVVGGNITAMTVNSGGEGYAEDPTNDIIYINAATIDPLNGVGYYIITIDNDDVGEFIIDPCDNTKVFGYVTGTCGSFSVSAQSPVLDSVKIQTDGDLQFEKECFFKATCDTRLYEDLKCEPQFWEEGTFAYWESSEKYPDNKELYDSSNLRIPVTTIDELGEDAKKEFEDAFVLGTDEITNEYILDTEKTNFSCQAIRHFKYPDNNISPFQDGLMTQGGILPFKSNKVYPIGFYLNNDIINKFLDIAVDNNLITKEFRDSIEFYEIFRGDSRLHKSILGKGITFDSWEYEEDDENIQFANFPFNDNRENKLIYTSGAREDYINHPDPNELKNNKYFFHSPEFSFDKPEIPFELEVESYLFGQSRGHFADVEDHPKFVVLSEKGERVAKILGGIESVLELTTDITDRLLDAAQSGNIFNPGQAVAWTAIAVYTVQRVTSESLVGLRQKIFEWQQILYNNGTPHNLTSYYVAEGYYNKIAGAKSDGNRLRGIVDGKYLKNGTYRYTVNISNTDRDDIKINHFNRVSSVFLHLGDSDEYSLQIPQSYYRNYDNSRIHNGYCSTADEARKKSPELQRSVQSPYISLKQYLPAQYGTIDSIRWISTGQCNYLNEVNECDATFGGDTYISRFSFKRHFPFFLSPMISPSGSLADNTPFSYSEQRNIGYPKYYLDYKIDPSKEYDFRITMPFITSFYNFDCERSKKVYVVPPSKFYLWYYGIPNPLVESRINLNLRYGGDNKEQDFFPNQADIVEWTQEKNVSNFWDNYYFYSYSYSTENDAYAYRFLDFRYNKEEWDCRTDHKDRTIYSLPDNNDQDTIDNWQVFRANNFNDFGVKYGDLIGLKNIESEKVIGRFENGLVIFNAFNTIAGSVEDIQVGTGGIFATRPTEFYRSDLGYGGTQHQAWVSSEFGHFWVDAKRGRVHQINPDGSGMQDITLKGWKNWFRENLPFKLKKQIPSIPNSFLDNAYNGPGIAMTWDDRYSRLFITKRDYRLNDEGCCSNIEYKEGEGLVKNLTKCDPATYPQEIKCPEGYQLNEEGTLCERILETDLVEIGQEPCQFDLVIVMDVSSSIDSNEQPDMIQLVRTLIDDYFRGSIDNGDIAIGVALFAQTARNLSCGGCLPNDTLTLRTGSADDIITIIDNGDFSKSGCTSIAAGYCQAHLQFEHWTNYDPIGQTRINVPKKILLLTDGNDLSQCGPVGVSNSNIVCRMDNVFDSITRPDNQSLSIDYEDLLHDLENFNYESIVIGIEGGTENQEPPTDYNQNADNLSTIHNSESNEGRLFQRDTFTSLLDSDFVNDVFLSLCGGPIYSCPPGWEESEEGDKCTFRKTVEPTYEDVTEAVSLDDECFEECSWTAAYSPMYETWIGHYDFIPNYYVAHTNYFQSGKNSGGDEFGLWSHLLTKKSFQVFYGKRYPWIIELPVKESFFNKRKGSIAYWLDVKRFHDNFDFAENRNKGFNEAVIYNHDENTGKLNLIRGEKNNLYQLQQYPKYNTDSVDILATQEQRKWTFNYIFDMVADKYNNVPIWLNDCPNVHKTLNPKAFNYLPTIKNNLRGDWFLVRFTQSLDSQHQYSFKWLTSDNIIYER